jgi:hypothetical protein
MIYVERHSGHWAADIGLVGQVRMLRKPMFLNGELKDEGDRRNDVVVEGAPSLRLIIVLKPPTY